MFFNFSSQKIKVVILSVVFLGLGILALVYMNGKWELTQALKLYAAKTSKDISYWTTYKMAAALDPRDPTFLLWKVVGQRKSAEPAISAQNARSVPVLAYHGLPNEGIGQIPGDVFFEQMKALKDDGWNTVSLPDFISYVKGEKQLPDKSFLLTFDDGRKDTFYPADPVLRDLGYKAVVFVISKRSLSENSNDSTYYLSAYELKEMEKTGRWDVQSHGRDSHDWYALDNSGTIGHYFSNKLWYSEQDRVETDEEYIDRIVYDLSHSKTELENALNKRVTAISYPFGDFGQETINHPGSSEIVTDESSKLYDMAFYQVRRGAVESFNYPENQFKIKRIEPHGDWSGERLLQTLNSGTAKNLPYSQSEFGMEWVSIWGESSAGESLNLKAGPETTGASAILNGSYLWEDYKFTSDVKWNGGSHVVLIAREKDAQNYFGCSFGPSKVTIKRNSNGVSSNLIEQYFEPGAFPRNLSLGIEVSGGNVSCTLNGEKIVEGVGINPIQSGGISIEVWDAKPGKADAVFDNIRVDEI